MGIPEEKSFDVEVSNLVVPNEMPISQLTGDSRYTRFRYTRLRISTILFQYYEEY
jgi:hypothetical protein